MKLAHPQPTVSIGLPVWNGENHLRAALEALLAQSYDDFEIVISDNASDDRTPEICREYASDRRIRYSRVPARISLAENWNAALHRSEGPFFMWAAHDDLWERDYISVLIQLLLDDPRASFALTGFDMIDGEGNPFAHEECRFDDFCSKNLYRRLLAFIASDFLGKGNAVHGLIKRSALLRVQGAQSIAEVHTPGDWLLIFRLLTKGYCRFQEDVLFHKRDAYTKSVQPRSLASRLDHQRAQIADYHRYAQKIEAELLSLEELSIGQRRDLVRIARLQARQLYLQKVLVLKAAAARRVRAGGVLSTSPTVADAGHP